MLLPGKLDTVIYTHLASVRRLNAGSALFPFSSGDDTRLFGASNRAVTLIRAESYLGTPY
jgi:hypothetical protein